MKVSEYRVEYKNKGEWRNADLVSFDNLKHAIDRLKIYRECDKLRGRNFEYRIVTRVVDYGEWVEAWT